MTGQRTSATQQPSCSESQTAKVEGETSCSIPPAMSTVTGVWQKKHMERMRAPCPSIKGIPRASIAHMAYRVVCPASST